MNRSGLALVDLYRDEPFDPGELLVCYDDLALPLGRLRIRPGGAHGGHNGMRSIIDRLGTAEFPRLRVGIFPESGSVRDATKFVLQPFSRGEERVIEDAVGQAVEAIECALADDLSVAMNRYNPEPL